MERTFGHKDLGYTTLGSLLDQPPQQLEILAKNNGHYDVDIRAEKFDAKKKEVKEIFAKGQIFRHKRSGKTVTVLQACIGLSDKGVSVHLVVESQSGRKFRALQSNLEVPS